MLRDVLQIDEVDDKMPATAAMLKDLIASGDETGGYDIDRVLEIAARAICLVEARNAHLILGLQREVQMLTTRVNILTDLRSDST